jgi:hypothetical protein
LHENVFVENVAGAPLHVTVAIPESVSATVPDTSTLEPMTVTPSAGDVMWTVGAVVSSLTIASTLAALSARSVTVAVTG